MRRGFEKAVLQMLDFTGKPHRLAVYVKRVK